MVLKLNIFTLVALGLVASSRSQPACECMGTIGTCANATACACESGQSCDVIVKVAAAGPATHLGCSGENCECDLTAPAAPFCTGAVIVTNGATEVEYNVTTDGSAKCEFALAGVVISGVKCTTSEISDVVQMGNLFTCTGVAIQTDDGTGCVFTADTSIACAAGSACTVASVQHSGLNCVGEGCSISVESSVETVNSESAAAVVSFSTVVGCTNPSGGGDCTCDSDSQSCTSSTVGALVTGGASATCAVVADRPTCTCNALGCDEPDPDVKTCTCEVIGADLATDCNGDASSCACHTGGNCKITVNYQTTPTGLTCSGETCECKFNGEQATCEGGPTITSGVTAAELTVTNVDTASCSINISDVGNVDRPACEGGANDTIGNGHFNCTGVIFDTSTPTGCKMLPQEIGECVGDDGCSITSLDDTHAKCVGALCSGSFTAGIVTMSSLGGDAVVQLSTVVTCTNPSGAGDCKCVHDTAMEVQSCTSTTDGGTVTGGEGSVCNNADCTSCDVGSVPTCTCDATSCEGCFCDGSPTDAPGPSVGPSDEMTTGDDEMTTDDEETTTKGLPSGAVMVSHVYGGWVVGSLVAVAVAKA